MDCYDAIRQSLSIKDELISSARETDKKCAPFYAEAERIKGYNQIKVLNAFRKLEIAPAHFAPTYGYGYSDLGREKLEALFSEIFHTEAALVRPQIASGTHALALALFGILRSGDTLVSLSGAPYDTLEGIIGTHNEDGSLRSMGVRYREIPLKDGKPDISAITEAAKSKPRMAMLQRSRGYALRDSISVDAMREVFSAVKKQSPDTIIMVDNCYGEFVQEVEPTEVGADIAVGSMIKNIGGGIAPTGGYIVGTAKAIESISYRLTAPGIGGEVGSYAASYLPFFEGLYFAPQVVCEAIKGAIFTAAMYSGAGRGVSPSFDSKRSCIIQTVQFGNEEDLVAFIQSIQQLSPVESNVLPVPWDMPGYSDKIIMAAGTFIQGASVELSADAPIRAPFTAFVQGGLAAEQVKAAVLNHLNKIN